MKSRFHLPAKLRLFIFVIFIEIFDFSWGFPTKPFTPKSQKYGPYIFYCSSASFYLIFMLIPYSPSPTDCYYQVKFSLWRKQIIPIPVHRKKPGKKILLRKKLERCHSECETCEGKWTIVGTVVLWEYRSKCAISNRIEQKND